MSPCMCHRARSSPTRYATALENNNLMYSSRHSIYLTILSAVLSNVSSEFKKRNYSKRKPWTKEERKIMTTEFAQALATGRLLRKDECEDCKHKHPNVLSARNWSHIKDFIRAESKRRARTVPSSNN